MDRRGLTISELARQIKRPKSNVCDWLNDKHEPGLESLRVLARFFGCSVASLVGDRAA